ncbi:MAG: glycosyltransferase family 9 protein [Abditibacteriota bacterium]|nr:glycosyltransferase family 9 protein [Abditibacteriota bacterium]
MSKNILITRVSAIGDVYMALPVAQELKSAMDCTITWLCEPYCRNLLEHHPAVDRVALWERKKHSKSLLHLLKATSKVKQELKDEYYDYVLDIHGRVKVIGLLKTLKHRKLIGYSRPENILELALYDEIVPVGKRIIYTDKNRLMVNAVLKDEGLDPLPADTVTYPRVPLEEEDRAKAARLTGEGPMIGIVYAASRECKYWQQEKWRELLPWITGELGYKCVLLGAPDDYGYGEEISRGIEGTVNIAGQTTLREALAVLERCSASICVDTAMLHFSVCQDIPTVCLYGSDVHLDQHVYRDNFLVIHKPANPRKPCQKRCHCRDFRCMKNITVDMVKSRLLEGLAMRKDR